VPTAVNLAAPAATSAVGLALGSVNGAFNLDVALSALETTGNGNSKEAPACCSGATDLKKRHPESIHSTPGAGVCNFVQARMGWLI